MASAVCRSLRKLPGKVGLGDIRLTPEMGKIDALESSLQGVLSKGGVSVIDTAGVYDNGHLCTPRSCVPPPCPSKLGKAGVLGAWGLGTCPPSKLANGLMDA